MMDTMERFVREGGQQSGRMSLKYDSLLDDDDHHHDNGDDEHDFYGGHDDQDFL